MPTYDYLCTFCGHKEEVLQKMSEEPLYQCPKCFKNTFKRQISAGIGLQFKGSGFYETDYKRKKEPCKGCAKKSTCPNLG